jgi:hypothetical protein
MALVSNEKSPAQDAHHALLIEIKERIRSAQYTVLRPVNLELLPFHRDIGRLIGERQQGKTWDGPWSRRSPPSFPASVASPLLT